MGESRWHRFKRWWIANDPDDLAREEYRLDAERRALVAATDRLRSAVMVEQEGTVAERYHSRRHLA